MIGQKNLKDQIRNGNLAHFMILVGAKGSGKKTLLSELFDGFDTIYLEDNKVDSVRKMIDIVYRVHKHIFIMPDADDMSLSARNALLKVVEDCPNDNYFIMTLEDEQNTLETIRSRAVIYHMENYAEDDLLEYIRDNFPEEYDYGLAPLLLDLCEVPGEINELIYSDVTEFYNYVVKVVDNIAEVSGANAFKIADKLNLKGDDSKYELKLFWKIFINICISRFKQNKAQIRRYATGCQITSKYLRDLKIKGINKSALFDAWLLSIRDEWLNYDGTE